jgi:hypothetical protein
MIKEIGIIAFAEDAFDISIFDEKKKSIKLNDIVKLRIEIQQSFNGFGFSRDEIVRLMFRTKESEVSYDLLLNGWREREQFIDLLKRLYKGNISIKEYDSSGSRAFLLNSKLSYKDIQRIKKEYNIAGNF